jgi:hypothetical protein
VRPVEVVADRVRPGRADLASELAWMSPLGYLPVIEVPVASRHSKPMATPPRTTQYSVAALLVSVKLAMVAPLAIVAAISSPDHHTLSVVGCLRQGIEKGTFVLASEHRGDTPAMSTVVGLTAHVGERVFVRGRMGVSKRYGMVLKIRSLQVVDPSCG